MIARLHLDGLRRHRVIALLIAIATVITVIVAPRIGRADTTRTVTATQDTTVASFYPDFVFGSWGAMAAGSANQVAAYVQFPSVAASPKKAVLRVKGPQSAVTIIANRTAASWQEGSLTWRSAQGLTNTTGIATGVRGSDGWTSIDVTTLVASGGITSFRLRAETRDLMWFSTKESGGAARLELTYPDAVTTTTAAPTTTRPATTTTAPPVTTTAPPVTTTRPPTTTTTAPPNPGPVTAIPSNFDVNQYITPNNEQIKSSTVGNFRAGCEFSHLAYDDPIVFPGGSGKSHLHMFFGNTGTNASSTYESLRRTGASTCSGGPINRSGYWVPAVLDAAGKVVVPEEIILYYKADNVDDTFSSTDLNKMEAFPPGLKMIAGFDPNRPGAKSHVEWYCEINQVKSERIPTCASGERIRAQLAFPNCWNGRDLDAPDHRSHMAYPSNAGSGFRCPTTHPRILPQFSIGVSFSHNGDSGSWRLSSDMAGNANGSTWHADWFGAWDQPIMDNWHRNCILARLDCQWGRMGDGRRLVDAANYTGPMRVSPPPR